jgi:hypothetical protein
MEDSLIDIRESIKDLWNEIKQAAQADSSANRVYMEWLERRIKPRHDREEQQSMLSSESEKDEGKESEEEEEEDEKEDGTTENLHHINSEPGREHRGYCIVASASVQRKTWKVIEKRPARPGR